MTAEDILKMMIGSLIMGDCIKAARISELEKEIASLKEQLGRIKNPKIVADA